MTLPRLADLTAYWAENPPVHVSMSAVLRGLSGNKKIRSSITPPALDSKGNPKSYSPRDLNEAVMMAGGGVVRRKNPQMKPK